MYDLTQAFDIEPFSLAKGARVKLQIEALNTLNQHHYQHCLPYRKIWDILESNGNSQDSLEKMPFIPVRLFKHYSLKSISDADVFKTMVSSGTSGQAVSKIFLDKATAMRQSRILTKIIGNFIGKERRPMLILDSKSVLQQRASFSARGAAILGFSMLGKNTTWALDANMNLDIEAVSAFFSQYKEEQPLLFGFTFIVWEYFYKPLVRLKMPINMSSSCLVHGGGWKTLIEKSVDNATFKRSLADVCAIKKIHNYYGMIEQTGSIYMECEAGFLHCSNFSDVFIRRPDFSLCEKGEKGLIQTISLLPTSYPGHNLLTEDIGEIIGEDDCACGRVGKFFKVHGRAKESELRGCSDAFAASR